MTNNSLKMFAVVAVGLGVVALAGVDFDGNVKPRSAELSPQQRLAIVADCKENPDTIRCR